MGSASSSCTPTARAAPLPAWSGRAKPGLRDGEGWGTHLSCAQTTLSTGLRRLCSHSGPCWRLINHLKVCGYWKLATLWRFSKYEWRVWNDSITYWLTILRGLPLCQLGSLMLILYRLQTTDCRWRATLALRWYKPQQAHHHLIWGWRRVGVRDGEL